jgi:DNA invertase Pin-like site-specific DNA recombinase
MTNLRFAPLIRVSTESQKNKGESLRTQKKQIVSSVEQLKGVIPEECWKYSGQEHATPDYERKNLDQLLKDSSKDLFDCIICCDASRWSRDNKRSKEGLEAFRQNGTRFFVGTMEYDLFLPEHILFLSMAVEIGEFQANQGAFKSIMNRIEKAKRGEPATRLPIGRTWSKENGWGVNPGVKEKFQSIAKQFLEGKTFTELGEMYGMNRNYLREILTKRCGHAWEQKFSSSKFDIHEIIPTKIPPLIDDPLIIEAVKNRVQANKTIFHGQRKQRYLFGRMLLCGHCGKALYGEMINYKTRNYRHRTHILRKGQKIKLDCNHFKLIPADLIEEPIMTHIFEIFGDTEKIEQAIKDTIPNIDEINDLNLRRNLLEKEKTTNKNRIERLIDIIEDGSADVESIKDRIIKHEERIKILEYEIAVIRSRIEKIPSAESIESKANFLKQMIKRYYMHSRRHYSSMKFDDRRKLLQAVFTGTDPEGNRCGIYIKKDNKNKEKPWLYEIRGQFLSELGRLSNKIKMVNIP